MLVVDIDALLAVDLLYLLDEVVAHALASELVVLDAADAQHVVRVERAGGELLALVHMVAVLDEDAARIRHGIHPGVALGLVRDGYCEDGVLARLLYADGAGNLAEHGHALRAAGLEQLLDSGQALGDVVAGYAAGVEGTHGELGARLADGLGGNDADGLAGVDGRADSQVDAVAAGADAAPGFAGHDAADHDAGDAVGLEHSGVGAHQHVVGIEHHLAGGRVGDGHRRITAVDADAEGLDLLALLNDRAGPDAVGGAAVVLADNDLLADVDQAAGSGSRSRRYAGRYLPGPCARLGWR